jgi:hypothetical protein
VLDGQQHGAAPFAAKAETLAEAAERQQQRRKNTDGLICGQEADGHGGDPHGHQRRNECRLSARAIPEVAEQRGTDWTREERNRERRE